jgi:hypothetical protein
MPVLGSRCDRQCPAIHSHLALLGPIPNPRRDFLAGEFHCRLHFSSAHLVEGLFRNLCRADVRGQRGVGDRNPADALMGARSTDDDFKTTQKKPRPNKSVTGLIDTSDVCLALDAAKVGLRDPNATDTFEFRGVTGCFSTMEIHRNGRPVILTCHLGNSKRSRI